MKLLELNRFFGWIIHFVHLQLFITLISLPFLIAWGMPFSLLSIIGNCLFSPFLTIFLMVSFLIFFCQLTCIPYGLLARALELISSWWLWCMDSHDAHIYMLGFITTSQWVLLMIPLIALVILHNSYLRSAHSQIIALTIALCIIIACLYWPRFNNPTTFSIAGPQGNISIIFSQNETILIDPGYLGSPKMSASWCQYTLARELISQTGTTHIDTIICMQPSYGALLALEKMIPTFNIKKIYMPFFIPQENNYHWQAFKGFKQTCTLHNTHIIRIYEKPIAINLDTGNTILITPLANTLETKYVHYKALQVTSTIDNKIMHHYSAKYRCKQTTDQSP